MTAIADYLVMAEAKASYSAIRARLAHVVSYCAATDQATVRCNQIDPAWVDRFRRWAIAQPIIAPGGAKRARAPSTVENSVLQLAAVIADRSGARPSFRALQPKHVNRTPAYRASVADLVRMFRYCLHPDSPTPAMAERHRHERRHLLAFLRISVATMARPDAAHDVSTAPDRRQWHGAQRVLNLNPAGRMQTRKYRATLPIAHQMAAVLDACDGALIPVVSVRSAWNAMADALGLPGNGEAGMKLVRRSVAQIARARLPEEAWGEVAMFLGHDRFDDTSDLYAPFSPSYLRRVLGVIEGLIDEIEAGCSGAFTAILPRGTSGK